MQHKLTKQQLKALKEADVISFHHHSDDEHYIRATKKINGAYNGSVDAEIPCKSDITIYNRYTSIDPGERQCFAHFSSAQYNLALQTAIGMLRAGDELRLKWVSDSNGYLRAARIDSNYADEDSASKNYHGARLHHDEIRLEVRRELKSGMKAMEFKLDDSICPDNSARMIRRKQW